MEQPSGNSNEVTNERVSANSDRADPLSQQDLPTDAARATGEQQALDGQNTLPETAATPSSVSISGSPSVDLSQVGEFTIYRPVSNHVGTIAREDLPPDFLEPTAEDLRSAQASLASRARAYRDAPLLTEKLRKQKDEESMKKWPTTTIRVKFADRSVLEKTFPSSSVIRPVYAFVRACLREDAKAYKFVLFETPPRRDLKVSDPNVRDKSLLDLHLTPRSVLHFRFLEDSVDLDVPTGPPPLHPEIMSRAIELPQPPESSPAAPSQPSPKSAKPGDSTDKSKKLARLLRLSSKK